MIFVTVKVIVLNKIETSGNVYLSCTQRGLNIVSQLKLCSAVTWQRRMQCNRGRMLVKARSCSVCLIMPVFADNKHVKNIFFSSLNNSFPSPSCVSSMSQWMAQLVGLSVTSQKNTIDCP